MAQYRNIFLFAAMALLILLTGFLQSWNSALLILNMGLISAIMSLGVNLQWGFAGLFNVGVMGFVALGGLATVLISMPPVTEAWSAGGLRTMLGLVIGVASLWLTSLAIVRLPSGKAKILGIIAGLIVGFFAFRFVFDGLNGISRRIGIADPTGLARWRAAGSGCGVGYWKNRLGLAL